MYFRQFIITKQFICILEDYNTKWCAGFAFLEYAVMIKKGGSKKLDHTRGLWSSGVAS